MITSYHNDFNKIQSQVITLPTGGVAKANAHKFKC